MLRFREGFIGVLVAVGVGQSGSLLGEDDEAKVTSILMAREREIKTFEADATVVAGPGRDLSAYGAARREFAKWLESHGRQDLAAAIELDLKKLPSLESQTSTCHEHYTMDGDLIRVDDPPLKSGMQLVSVWSAGSWSSLGEISQSTAANDDPELHCCAVFLGGESGACPRRRSVY